ncbi:cytochrome c biogenesis protein CcsA [Propionispira raffinosivorans]|uniref:cytochrome c biogenesis protein CcsA n=1 Tax=Propionispira raffinosivorans TaxID=86959 RepID=UPI0003663FF9|nr:cytochrome c biogenesis protein CcsA [Propionispira raffinosivorans]
MIGVVSFYVSCLLSIIAFIGYLFSSLGNSVNKKSPWLDKIYYLSVLFIVAASMFYMQAILSDKFQYIYIYNYSSINLTFWYKVAVFWAGQEGSFLLWMLIHSVLGFYFLKSGKMNRPTFTFYAMIQVLLVIFLLIKNPFMIGGMHLDGVGMNPLLQDFLMVIHPPIIFIGYSVFVVPFVYALGNLFSAKPSTKWISRSLPWALFAWLFLGAGIFIGGYWAYKTLGWGGYWGWDPVENASLIPWLTGGALVHLLYLSRIHAGVRRLTHFTAILTFSLILYGTFLTRSGVLNDFSVHAFSGDDSASLLAICILAVIGVAFVIFLFRYRSIESVSFPNTLFSRAFTLMTGSMLFYALAVLIFIGTSTPLVSTIIGSPQNIDTSFYNHAIVLPVLIVLAALSFCPFIMWNGRQKLGRSKSFFLILSFLTGCILCIFYQIYNPLYIAVVSFSALAIGMHIVQYKSISLPACLAHIGIALLCAGIIFSSVASITMDGLVFAKENPSLTVYNMQLTYNGGSMSEDGMAADYNFTFDGIPMTLVTKLNTEGQIVLKKPAILHKFIGDYYLADLNRNLTLSFKPLIILVWSGCMLITAGCFFAFFKRFKKQL